MASSSSSGNQRRRPLTKRQPPSRQNSSFLGSLKSIVTAPLAWFASTDDFEDSKDFQGKRRRLAVAPSEPPAEDNDRSARNKRMRIHSPSRDESYSQTTASVHGYLDPPGSVFQSQQRRQSNPLVQPSSIRSLSVTQSYDLNNNNNNRLQANMLSRTMSIDPPPRPLSSGYAASSIHLHRDTSIDSSNLIRTVSRDLSMPPLSGRPSFLMRTSMTPQPLREVSEPPPLKTLYSNPTFLHAPSEPSKPLHNELKRSSSVTLGSLVDSVRRHHSPARQHSSLVFSEADLKPASTSKLNIAISRKYELSVVSGPHPETVIEKALHEMDIYKTPLVPTRLRSSNISATASSTNMFKSRRASNLVLMQEDGRSERLGRKVNGKKEALLPNKSKPYAGEGGMKRLLARRKQEENEEKSSFPVDDQQMDDDTQASHENAVHSSDTTSEPVMPIPPPPKAVRVSLGAASSVQSSSLRVGRTKNRNHIVRPTGLKFSAAFDEEATDEVDEARRKEMDVMNEAAKRVPTKAIDIDSSGGNEPPIKTLPFSISNVVERSTEFPPKQDNSCPIVHSPLPQAQTVETTRSSAAPFATVAVPNGVHNKPITLQPSSSEASSNGVPNFFATSSTLSKPLDIPSPAPLVFNVSTTASTNPPAPVKDADNPLWEGESKRTTEPLASKFPLFDSIRSTNGNGPSANAELGSVDIAAPAAITSLTPAPSIGESGLPSLSQPMSGGGSSLTSFSSFPKSTEPPVPAVVGVETSKAPFITTPAPVFDASTSSGVFGGLSKAAVPVPILFGNSMNGPAQIAPPGPASLIFGQTMTSTSSAVEASKPLFGPVDVLKPNGGNGSGGSSFGGSIPNKEPANTPFSFGTTRSKDTDQKQDNSVFSFGNTGAKDAETKSVSSTFSFGKTDGLEQKPASNPFSFGNVGAPPGQKPAFSFENKSNEMGGKNTTNPFSFGAAPSTPPADGTRAPLFTFGVPAPSASVPAPASVGFSFSSSDSDASTKPFGFGQSARPVTPPKNQELEVNMDESPTRDTQQVLKPVAAPAIGSSGFAFGTSTPASSFGSQSISTPFSFGGTSSTATTNAFGKPPEGNSFSFGQAAPTTSSFRFGQSKPEHEPPRPSTTGSFSFGAPTSAAGSTPIFPFGGPSNNSTGSTFGQSQSGSAPGSPSTFAQQSSPFSFGAPLPPVNTAFSFGSQSASPVGVNISLPQPATPGGFGNTSTSGFGQAPQPASASPFNASNMAAPATGGATLFTIGAAPAAPAGTGTRPIRKLPKRGGAKR
ncbi:hypothetical protein C0992_005664 [Termitomyces sp. T32_za158]|nr:hypothetical protein C0992_005664 [Termitomyces sp. T32_za158]